MCLLIMCNKVLCYHTSSCIHVLCVLKTFSFLKSKYWKGAAIIFFPLFSKYLNVNITEQNSTCKKQLFVLWVIIGMFVEVICQHFTCFWLLSPGLFFFVCMRVLHFYKFDHLLLQGMRSLPETCNFAWNS